LEKIYIPTKDIFIKIGDKILREKKYSRPSFETVVVLDIVKCKVFQTDLCTKVCLGYYLQLESVEPWLCLTPETSFTKTETKPNIIINKITEL
jgi:hypothetical protein